MFLCFLYFYFLSMDGTKKKLCYKWCSVPWK